MYIYIYVYIYNYIYIHIILQDTIGQLRHWQNLKLVHYFHHRSIYSCFTNHQPFLRSTCDTVRFWSFRMTQLSSACMEYLPALAASILCTCLSTVFRLAQIVYIYIYTYIHTNLYMQFILIPWLSSHPLFLYTMHHNVSQCISIYLSIYLPVESNLI